jgi:hypothetical protein
MFLFVAVTDLKQKVRKTAEHGLRTTGGPGVPQIWLTYDELAVLMECDPAAARSAASAIQLDRRKSRDGNTRAKLNPALTEAFLDGVLRQRFDQEIAACADDLRAMRERMTARAAALPRFRSAAAG